MNFRCWDDFQGAADSKMRVAIPVGKTTITTPLSLSTIGQIIEGDSLATLGGTGSLVEQATEGENGIEFTGTDDSLIVGGGGIYCSTLRDISLQSSHNNSGTGITYGADDTHSGDYCRVENVYLARWQTAIHCNSMAMTWLQNVIVNNPVDAPGDVGIQMIGGSCNSHLHMAVTMGNVTTGYKWDTVGFGNVVMPGDFGGVMQTAIDVSEAAQITIIGGNFEGSISGTTFKVGVGAKILAMGVGGQGLHAAPAFDCTNGYGCLVRINSAIGCVGGIAVTGAGYGTTMAMEPYFDVDTQFSAGGRKWKEQPFPSVFRAALTAKCPADEDHYGAIAHVIRDNSGHGGLCRVSVDGNGSYFYDWICKEEQP